MKVKIQKIDSLTRKITVSDELHDLEDSILKRANTIRPKINIDGFRKGKAPISLIKEKYHPHLRSEALNDVIKDKLFKAIESKNLDPANIPNIMDVEDKDNKINFSATFEIHPSVKLKALKKYKFTLLVGEVQEKDINEQIERLKETQKVWNSVDENYIIKNKNKVSLKLEAFLSKDDGSSQFNETFENELGTGQLFPEIEENILKHKKNDLIEMDFCFPEDPSHQNPMSGKKFYFKIRIEDVYESSLPELNKVFFERFGVNSLESFTEKIEEKLQLQLNQKLEDINKKIVFDGLVEEVVFDVPSSILKKEKETIAKQKVQMAENQINEEASKRIRMGYIFSHIIKENKIKISEKNINDFFEKEIKDLGQIKNIKDDQNQLQNIKSFLLEKKVFNFMIDCAKIKYDKKSFQEIIGRK